MPWLTTRRLALAALAAWLAVAALNLALGPPLGHDEAAFAVIARGEQPPGTWLYRSDGTVALARLGVALGGAPWQLRLASALLGASIVAAAFAVGRAAFSARTGAWAAAVIAGAHPMALRSAQLLGDLPAAACVLGGIAALAGELDREAGPRWRIAAAAPLFAAAFYLRYGSAPAIAVALAAAGLVWRRAIAARPLPALGVLAALAALAVPHLVRSHGATGSALGILEVSAGMPRRAYLGEGLVTYVTSEPLRFYGVLVAPVMAAGLLGLVRTRRRAPWYLAIVALGQLVALGVQSHGQSRYVFVAVVLLVVLGVDAAARLARPRLALAAVATAWLGVAGASVVVCRHLEQQRAPIAAAGGAIRGDAAGRPCAVVAAAVPQLVWYSRCQVYLASRLDAPTPADRVRYAVALAHGSIDLGAIAALHQLRAVPVATGDPAAQVWRLE
ncbi:MAG TPA: glycosyltransferase family 39 protein [Kofleriaceae bacterium]|nr:glycosyltransferase family 39 protein [Kofleriaceae bacterium]